MNLILKILDKYNISASNAQADDFEMWVVKKLWSKYIDEKMNKSITIVNKIKALSGLHFNNGTVGKDYCSRIEIPNDLVEDVWVKGLDQLGLRQDDFESSKVVEVPSRENDQAELILCESVSLSEVETQSNVISIDREGELNQPGIITEDNVDRKPNKFIVQISGRPLKPGDFAINLVFKPKGWVDGEDLAEISIPIAFNPDPRALWRNIPTSKDVFYYKPDSEVDYVLVTGSEDSGPRKDIIAASQRGRSHAQEGKARDDHFKLYHCDDSDWYIIAVADGAGSAKYSRKGSEIACDTVVDYCKEQLQDTTVLEDKIRDYKSCNNEEDARKQMANAIYNIIGNAAFMAHKNIKIAAEANTETKLKDYATTLMFAICKKFDFGWFVASYWVGDGAMCVFNEEKKAFKLLGVPDEGEFSGQTRFLTMPEIFKDPKAVMDRLRFSIEDDFTALILLTDGVSDPMFGTENNLNSYDKWSEFWNKLKTGFPEDEIPGVDLSDDNVEAKHQLLNWLDFWSPGNHDDRTIAILY